MKRNFEDYKILVRHNENEEFKEIQCVEHGTEEMIVGVSTEAHITHWITFIDENGTLRKQSFKNEYVKFELKTSTDGFKFTIDGTKACEEIKKLISEEVSKLKRLGAVQ